MRSDELSRALKTERYWKAPRLYICSTWQISLGSQLFPWQVSAKMAIGQFWVTGKKLAFELISGCELEDLIKIQGSYLSPVMLHCSGSLISLPLKQSCIIRQTLPACVRIISVDLPNGPLGFFALLSFLCFCFCFLTFCLWFVGVLATFIRVHHNLSVG